ncbi:uronate isomerase [Spirochaetia bacterium]|nr:uronate isomerase [Spirochaetia bacterium]
MDRDFLLYTKTARKLFHEAAGEPIFDYHCHLSPREIAEDRRFTDLASMWLGGDHYKWRVLRANGVDEAFITGNAEPYDKFLAWADTAPRLIGNPLYHWTHLELQRYFNIDDTLNRESAPAIWKAANDRLQNDPELSVRGIFKKFKVYALGTTDAPEDSLEWHAKIADTGKSTAGGAAGEASTKVLPSFRPDRALNMEKPDFAAYIAQLGRAAGKKIEQLTDLLAVLHDRLDLFDKMGCRAADHGLEYMPFEAAADGSTGSTWEKEVSGTFSRVLAGEKVDGRAAESYKTFLLTFLAEEYHDRQWAMQLHLGVIRNTNSRAFRELGPDTGFDAVHDHPVAAKLARFLDTLETRDKVPKTILYSLNINDFYPLATIMGSFQGKIPGKMQLGSSWWFLDHKDGMEAQMKLLGNVGLLSAFVGMLTDSRSFLSYPRHEYFRRILCNLIGTWAEDGEIPADFALLSGMVRDISFGNIRTFLEKV